jgi:hypothetical protein
MPAGPRSFEGSLGGGKRAGYVSIGCARLESSRDAFARPARDFFARGGIESEPINELHEGRPNIVDGIMDKRIHLVINTPFGRKSQRDDSHIRKTAIKYKVPCVTTLAAALASAKGIAASRNGHAGMKSPQECHAGISRH